MREYFVALRVEKLLRGKPLEWPKFLIEAKVSFLPDLMADYADTIDLSANGRMVRVGRGHAFTGRRARVT